VRILLAILSELSHETRLERMAESLRCSGHEVCVTWVDNGTAEISSFWDDYKIIRLPNPRAGRRKLYFLKFMQQVYSLIKKEKPDAVLAIDPPALVPASLLKVKQNFRLIYDSREYYTQLPTIRERTLVKIFWAFWESRGMRLADANFSVCASIATELERKYSLSRVDIIRNVSPRSFDPQAKSVFPVPADKTALKNISPILGDLPLVLYQGGFWSGYDFRPLMRAIEILSEEGISVDLLMLGDGPELAKHQEFARASNYRDRFVMAGKVKSKDLPELTATADIGTVLVPDLGLSYRYLLPNKIFEYVQAGLSLLCSPFPELASIALGKNIGLCADPKNEIAISKAIKQMLAPGWRDTRKANFRLAAEELCWENEKNQFIRYFS
jgi:glycosyltransferase involved in cell wall biosynthesis